MEIFYRILHAITTFLNALYAFIYFPSRVGYTPVINDPLFLLSATQIAEKIKNGQLTCEQVVRAYLKRIEMCNPIINCYIDIRYDAVNDARQLDEAIAQERKGVLREDGVSLLSLPLLGVPFSIKDSVCVKGMKLTSGLKSRADCISDTDAEVIFNIKAAGGIPIGMTNVPELLMWFDCNNRLFGQTCNPYDLSYIPGGSSGGEGAAISSASSVVGVGSDIGGSCRIPAAFCGIFGHKTTGGVISKQGKYPPIEDTHNLLFAFGPMCRYAVDLIPFLKAMAGKDIQKLPKIDETVDISKLKFYYVDDVKDPSKSPVSPEVSGAIKKAVKYLETTYHVTCEKIQLDIIRDSKPVYTATLMSLKKNSHSFEMTNRQGTLNPFLEAIKYVFGVSTHTMPAIFYACWERMFKNKLLAKSKELAEQREKIKQQFNEMLGPNGVLLYPPMPMPGIKHGNTLLKFTDVFYMSLFNLLAVPVTQCPLGLSSKGLPLGVQIVSTPFNDHLTIAVATALEKGLGGWVSPGKIEC